MVLALGGPDGEGSVVPLSGASGDDAGTAGAVVGGASDFGDPWVQRLSMSQSSITVLPDVYGRCGRAGPTCDRVRRAGSRTSPSTCGFLAYPRCRSDPLSVHRETLERCRGDPDGAEVVALREPTLASSEDAEDDGSANGDESTRVVKSGRGGLPWLTRVRQSASRAGR